MKSFSKIRIAVLGALLALCTAPAFAQGCAMCYQTVKGAPKEAQRTLNRAILVMLVLPLGTMTLGVGAAFRYSKRRDRENGTTDESVREHSSTRAD
jgi:hypothetical protein